MRSRSSPILVFGFGFLIVLIGLSGLGASRRAHLIYDELVSIHESDRQGRRLLNEINSGMQLSGIFIRDYLLDPSDLTASMHRERLKEIRDLMTKQLEELDRLMGRENGEALRLLRDEVDGYWDSMDPVFDWTPQQKIAVSSLFLRKRVLPRRDAVVQMAQEIRKLNQSNLDRQQQKLNRSLAEFRAYLWWMIGVALMLGVLVAAGSVFRISRLERRTEEQQHRTERAERELRRLSQQLVQAQEAERKSISRELHDQVGQMLTALRMDLANLEELREAPEEEFRRRLEEVKRIAEQTLGAVRHLSMGLRPAMLDDLGLGPALEWLGREFSRRSNIPVNVQIEGALEGLPDTHRTCVFRVVQEALTNCARHARAGSIRVTVHGLPESLSLAVQDDGVGFAVAESAGRGLGLIGIEERVRELGGTVEVVSQPDKGTLLRVEIPSGREVMA